MKYQNLKKAYSPSSNLLPVMNIEHFTMSDSEYTEIAKRLIEKNTPTLNDFQRKITTIAGIKRGNIDINNTDVFSDKERNLIKQLIEEDKLFIFFQSLILVREQRNAQRLEEQQKLEQQRLEQQRLEEQKLEEQQRRQLMTTRYVDTPIIEDKSMNTVTIDSPDPNLHKHEIIHSHDPELHTAQKRIRHFQT